MREVHILVFPRTRSLRVSTTSAPVVSRVNWVIFLGFENWRELYSCWLRSDVSMIYRLYTRLD